MRGSTKAALTAIALTVFAIAGGSAYYYAHPQIQAKHTLNQFLRAYRHGDSEGFCRYSVYEQFAPFFEMFGGADESRPKEDRIAEELEGILEGTEEIRSFEVSGTSEYLDGMAEQAKTIRENHELELKILADHDLEENADDAENYQKMLSYFESVKHAYVFDVTVQYRDEAQQPETMQIAVTKSSGRWKADPFTPMMLIPKIHDPYEQDT